MHNTSPSNSKDIAVRVAVRIRPLVSREMEEGCQECLDVLTENNQVVVRGTDKAFTYDFVFPAMTSQDYVYDSAVAKMVKELFNGYNVTILAYGQTGSGKTYSMGTSSINVNDGEAGIIQRAVKDIFEEILEKTDYEIIAKVSFIELYKESLYDLLNHKSREEAQVDIREDARGGIKFSGLTEIPVTSLEEAMRCLEHGALNRATGATAMNARSSRSHAIYSLHLEIGKKSESDNIVSAKFHLVDLAGSERAKKTGATGERFKEGVNINRGLLSLGNVISALCGEGSKGHIPYRNSKLTRLLQDSLGGNSHTLMLACVSPADSNLEESLSTLRYADRARKIKNKPVVNRDPQAAELARLRQQVQQLQVQLISAGSGPGGSIIHNSSEVTGLLNHVHTLEEENEKLMRALQTALDENTNMAEKALMAEMARDQLKTKLEELRAQTGNTVEVLNKTLETSPHLSEQVNLVKELQQKIIDLQMDQHKREKAIVDHELSRHSSVSNTKDSVAETNDSTDEMETQDSPVKGNFGTAFTLKQAKLNEELQDLNRALAMKEELMTKMTANDSRFVAIKTSYERNLKDFEEQINYLLKEKEELTQKLRNVSHQNASNKVSEQRRKRLQELEGLISGLKRKITEQSKLLKIKEQSEQKVTKLNGEIQNMKAVRVKLIRQMKEDSEKFRKWKAQKDREVAKLKEEDRKKQFQIVKMERLHSKQQNVLKRKMEEAVAINKRLKDAMALQKDCQERRHASKDLESVSSRVKKWLEGELEVVTVKKQAKKSLETLMEDRKTISEQLSKVKRQLQKGEFSPALQEELNTRKEALSRELELRTAQISDIQMRVVDEDGESSKRKWSDAIQTMVEAKCAMQFLFEVASGNKVLAAECESELKELTAQYEEVCQNLSEAEAEAKATLKAMTEKHQDEMDKISRETEDKILFLLRQMPKTQEGEPVERNEETNSALEERLRFQEEELSRLSHLSDLLQQKTVECEELKQRLQEMQATLAVSSEPRNLSFESEQEKTSKRRSQDDYSDDEEPSEMSAPKVRRASKKPKISREPSKEVSSNMYEDTWESSDSSLDEEVEESARDPDWQKTPLYKKIRQLTSRKLPQDSSEDADMFWASKRSSASEIKCGCSKNCSTKICKCKKNDNACSSWCKCNALLCINRSFVNDNNSVKSDGSKDETYLNSTFDVSLTNKPPLSENSSPTKRIRSSEIKGLGNSGLENVEPQKSPDETIRIGDFKFSMPPL